MGVFWYIGAWYNGEVLCSLTLYCHSWEQHFSKLGMEFGKAGENFRKQELDFCNFEVGHFGMCR